MKSVTAPAQQFSKYSDIPFRKNPHGLYFTISVFQNFAFTFAVPSAYSDSDRPGLSPGSLLPSAETFIFDLVYVPASALIRYFVFYSLLCLMSIVKCYFGIVQNLSGLSRGTAAWFFLYFMNFSIRQVCVFSFSS